MSPLGDHRICDMSDITLKVYRDAINQELRERREEAQKKIEKACPFKVGDIVEWQSMGDSYFGEVIKINSKTIKVTYRRDGAPPHYLPFDKWNLAWDRPKLKEQGDE